MAGNIIMRVKGCVRCEGLHPEMVFVPLKRAVDGWSHFSLCPTTREPVMLNSQSFNSPKPSAPMELQQVDEFAALEDVLKSDISDADARAMALDLLSLRHDPAMMNHAVGDMPS